MQKRIQIYIYKNYTSYSICYGNVIFIAKAMFVNLLSIRSHKDLWKIFKTILKNPLKFIEFFLRLRTFDGK